MNGKIYFDNAGELAVFLSAFTGQTATFEVRPNGDAGYVLTFTGGY